MEQAIRLVPTLPPWVKESIQRAGTLADMEMKKSSYATLHKEENLMQSHDCRHLLTIAQLH